MKLSLPFDLDGYIYWLFYAIVIILISITASCNITHDCLLAGLIYHGCAQLKIIFHRFEEEIGKNYLNKNKIEKKTEEKRSFKNFIQHHELIYK